MKRTLKRSLWSLTAVPFLIAVVVAINLLSLFFFTRVDLTDERQYSLSDASKRLAESLDDPVLVKLYFTEDLPAPYSSNARYLKDQLYEYRAYSGGQIRVEIIDPVKSDRENEAAGYRIPPVQVQVLEKDKVELKKVYMGVVFLYEDKQEVLPVIQSTANLEYEISSALRKVTTDELPVIGFLSGHGEAGPYTNMQLAHEALNQLYRVRTVSITPGQLIDSTISTLLIANPTDSISLWDQYAIDQFVMRGGKLSVLYDPVVTDLQAQTASDRESNWDEFLAAYGMRAEPNLIIDVLCGQILVTQQQGQIRFQNQIPFPFMPESRLFNPDNLIGKDLESVGFLFASAIDSTQAESAGVVMTPICWSSPRTGLRRAPYYVSPMQEYSESDYQDGSQIIAAALTGVFKTAFPQGPPADTGYVAVPTAHRSESILPGRMVFVGDADFCTDQGIRGGSNPAFFLNIIDWLTQDESLITIRSREVTTRPLEEVSDGQRRLVKYANVFGPPLLVILLGVWRWQTRRRAKRG